MEIKGEFSKMVNLTKTIYFAHPFEMWNSPEELRITKILESKGYIVYNPFNESEQDLCNKYGVKNYYDNPTEEFAYDIVKTDLSAIDKCEYFFAWFPKGIRTIGTPIELHYAYKIGKIKIVLCDKAHPFAIYYSNYLFYTIDEVEKFNEEWRI